MPDLWRQNVYVCPPLLRSEVLGLDGTQEEFLLVYLLNDGYADEIAAWHQNHRDLKVVGFWDRPGVAETTMLHDNLIFHQLSSVKFLALMRRCRAFVSTAGFESICEALYLGKPSLIVPTGGHFFWTLRSETQPLGPCTVLFHTGQGQTDGRSDAGDRYLITDRCLRSLDFPMIGSTLIPGHPHFCLLLYFRDHPAFDYYWLVEYDVRYRGSWRRFFEHFDDVDADLLTTNIYPYETMPEWPWWELDHPHESIAPEQRIRSFNPIYRVSRSALGLIDESHRLGWRGHSEVLLPTLLSRAGLSIEDIGGDGPFVPASRKNRFYTSSSPKLDGSLEEGTFRFRPTFPEMGEEPDKLYHPVKEPGADLWETAWSQQES